MKKNQGTISNPFTIEGIGIHSGKPVKMTIKGAKADTGVIFKRVDLGNTPLIPADFSNIEPKPRRTRLTAGAAVETTEHLLATLFVLGIDNLLIELNSEELPALDGSALPFYNLLKNAGIIRQDAPKKNIVIKRKLSVSDGIGQIDFLPADSGLWISYELSYGHPTNLKQSVEIQITEESFVREIAPARTFCTEAEADSLIKLGLGKGATRENTIIVGRDGRTSCELRFPDECARHKILDVLGDLFFVKANISGRIKCSKSGHSLNRELVQKILAVPHKNNGGKLMLDILQIQDILPHRYPFLMIDRVVEVEPGKRAVGIKNVSINEEYFQGHFPGQPVMPGVLQIEAMAQLAGALLLKDIGGNGKLPFLMTIDKVKFRKAVVPGDQLVLEAEVVRVRDRSGEVKTRALVDNKVVAEAQIRFMLVDKMQNSF